MPFSTPMAIAVFLTLWFVVLFAVLPFGVTSQSESESYLQGTDPGAPVTPRLLLKAVWTTVVTAILFGVLVAFAHFIE
jgi:predicted secreted protein